MEVIRRVLVVLGHIHIGGNSGQLVDELEMKRLTRKRRTLACIRTQRMSEGI